MCQDPRQVLIHRLLLLLDPFHLVQLFLLREISTLILPPDVDGSEVFERSFDFSEFPNLQEVEFGVGWRCNGLPWIHIALSTLRPATSPRLSTIQLDFTRPSPSGRFVDVFTESVGDDLRWIADEIVRIEREFMGAVNSTVLRDPWFKMVFDTLNVRSLWQANDTSRSHQTP